MHRDTVIRVSNLRKTYGTVVAVDDISFEVHDREIFGFVGPNGAGKTTTLSCVEGIRRYDSGQIEVLGLDPRKDAYAVRERLGIQLQESRLQARIRVWEALDLFASFFAHPLKWETLLEPLGLAEKRNALYSDLSGGQKQRLFVGLALVGDGELLFLDELSTGLDPHARRTLWALISDLRDRGKTIVLSTHSMEEAQRLCDRVAILYHGRIVALDTPADLIDDNGAETLEDVFLQLTGHEASPVGWEA